MVKESKDDHKNIPPHSGNSLEHTPDQEEERERREKLFDKILKGIMVSLTVLGAAIFGYYLCDQTKVKPIRDIIKGYEKGRTLGETLEHMYPKEFSYWNKRKKGLDNIVKEIFGEDFFEVYLEEVKAKDLYNFSFNAPQLFTPQVISGLNPGKSANTKINNQQLRANQDVEIPKPKNTYYIFLSGGSTAYGSGAPSQETTIGGYLEEVLNEKENINLNFKVFIAANPAWDSAKERDMIAYNLVDLNPDLVISLSGINEVGSGINNEDTQWRFIRNDEYFYRILGKAHKLYGREDSKFSRQLKRKETPPNEMAAIFIENMNFAGKKLSEKNSKLILAFQPTYPLTNKQLTKGERKIGGIFLPDEKFQEYLLKYHEEVLNILQELPENKRKFEFYDLSNIFDNIEKRVFIDSCHFGSRGNKIIAEYLAKIVQEQINE